MKKILLILFCIPTSILRGQQPRLVLPIGHTGYITCAGYSNNGKYILTGSYDNSVKVWDAITGFLLINLVGHKDIILKVQFSTDDKKILTTSCDSTVKIWDTNSGLLLHELKGSAECIYTANFSNDGKNIVASSGDSIGSVWDGNNGELIANLKGHHGSINEARFSHDGKRVVTASKDSTTKVWDAKTGKLLGTLKGHLGPVNNVQFSPDDKLILTVSEDRIVGIWDAKSYTSLRTLIGHIDFITVGEFSPDGKKILTASWDGSAIIWDVKSGKTLIEFSHRDWIISARFSPDGKKVATSSKDGIVKIWSSNSGLMITEIHRNLLKEAMFSTDGKKILTISGGSLVSNFYSADVWDAQSGTLFKDLTGTSSEVFNAAFSSNGKKLLIASKKKRPEIWDASAGIIKTTLKGYDEDIRSADFSNDGNKIITVTEDNLVRIWDSLTGETIVMNKERFSVETARLRVKSAQLSTDGKKAIIIYGAPEFVEILNSDSGRHLLSLKHSSSSSISSAKFSPDQKKIVTTSGDNTARIWNTESGKSFIELKGHASTVDYAEFSPDGKRIVTCSGTIVKVWDTNSGLLLQVLKGHTEGVNYAQYSLDGKKIMTCFKKNVWGKDHAVKIWDAETGELLNDLNGHRSWINSAQFSPDSKIIATASNDHTVCLRDISTGKLLAELGEHVSGVNTAKFSPDGKKIITASDDNTTKLWEVPSGKLICTLLSVDSSAYFLQIPSGYYQCSSKAAKLLHYVTKDLKVISFEQLDVKYNRPDKVLEAIGNTDTTLIKSYRKAYEKRIKKLAIDTTSFRAGYSVPEADFANRDNIELEQKQGKLKLHIKGLDIAYKLDRFNVWVNETPIFGQRGISILRKNKNNLDTTISINLSQGENRIETSISNVNGTESYRMPLMVNYTPAIKQKEKTHFVGIGIDRFVENKYNLQYSAKDIRDLAKKLKEKYKDDIIIDTLFNENVTVSSVKALKKKLLQTSENDKVMIAYSGHGMLSKDYDYYLSTYAVNFENPVQDGLPYDELENLLDSIPARKKLLLIDACHSGEVDKEELEKLKTNMATAAAEINGAKGVTPLFTPGLKKLGIKNSFELMQELFVNVGRSTGATVISAAGGTQFALERGDLKNGVFTYSILEFMKEHPTATITELKTYVNRRVPELTKGLQVPTSRTETNSMIWNVW